jgi:hypothetical protein
MLTFILSQETVAVTSTGAEGVLYSGGLGGAHHAEPGTSVHYSTIMRNTGPVVFRG